MSTGMNRMPATSANVEIHVGEPGIDKKASTAGKLLKFAGTWKGDDLEECLNEVYMTRGETTF